MVEYGLLRVLVRRRGKHRKAIACFKVNTLSRLERVPKLTERLKWPANAQIERLKASMSLGSIVGSGHGTRGPSLGGPSMASLSEGRGWSGDRCLLAKHAVKAAWLLLV